MLSRLFKLTALFCTLCTLVMSPGALATTIFASGFDGKIHEYDANGNELNAYHIGFTAGSMGYDANADKLYFGWYSGGSNNYGVWSMNGDGTGLSRIYSATSRNRSLAVDYINGYLFTDFDGSEGLVRMNLDGTGAVQIDNSFIQYSIGAMVTDHRTQTLFVGDFGDGQTIKTMDYSGGSQTSLVGGLDGNLHQMAIDFTADKLYTVSNSAGPIYRSNLDGSALEIVANSFSNPLGIALDTDNGYMFIGESSGGVERINLDGTGRVQITNQGVFGLAARTGVAVPEPWTLGLLLLGLAGLHRRAIIHRSWTSSNQ